MMKRDDLEATFVDVEVDVPLLEIGRMGSPRDRLRITGFDRKPGFVTQTLPMLANLQEK